MTKSNPNWVETPVQTEVCEAVCEAPRVKEPKKVWAIKKVSEYEVSSGEAIKVDSKELAEMVGVSINMTAEKLSQKSIDRDLNRMADLKAKIGKLTDLLVGLVDEQ